MRLFLVEIIYTAFKNTEKSNKIKNIEFKTNNSEVIKSNKTLSKLQKKEYTNIHQCNSVLFYNAKILNASSDASKPKQMHKSDLKNCQLNNLFLDSKLINYKESMRKDNLQKTVLHSDKEIFMKKYNEKSQFETFNGKKIYEKFINIHQQKSKHLKDENNQNINKPIKNLPDDANLKIQNLFNQNIAIFKKHKNSINKCKSLVKKQLSLLQSSQIHIAKFTKLSLKLFTFLKSYQEFKFHYTYAKHIKQISSNRLSKSSLHDNYIENPFKLIKADKNKPNLNEMSKISNCDLNSSKSSIEKNEKTYFTRLSNKNIKQVLKEKFNLKYPLKPNDCIKNQIFIVEKTNYHLLQQNTLFPIQQTISEYKFLSKSTLNSNNDLFSSNNNSEDEYQDSEDDSSEKSEDFELSTSKSFSLNEKKLYNQHRCFRNRRNANTIDTLITEFDFIKNICKESINFPKSFSFSPGWRNYHLSDISSYKFLKQNPFLFELSEKYNLQKYAPSIHNIVIFNTFMKKIDRSLLFFVFILFVFIYVQHLS
ncbi:hypothetical protein NUSPORA_00408 [Nucleospora cyclopteri]